MYETSTSPGSYTSPPCGSYINLRWILLRTHMNFRHPNKSEFFNCKIKGSGTSSFFVHGRLGKPVHMNLINVLYVPSLANRLGGNYLRLVRVRKAVQAGYKFIFTKDSDLLEHHNGTQIDLIQSGELTRLPNHFLPSSSISVTRHRIHRHFGHFREDGLFKLD